MIGTIHHHHNIKLLYTYEVQNTNEKSGARNRVGYRRHHCVSDNIREVSRGEQICEVKNLAKIIIIIALLR